MKSILDFAVREGGEGRGGRGVKVMEVQMLLQMLDSGDYLEVVHSESGDQFIIRMSIIFLLMLSLSSLILRYQCILNSPVKIQ